jgi:hypothetical protein
MKPYDQRIADAAAATEEYFSRINYPKALQYYIGGDVCVNLPDKPWLLKEWNKFLKERYGDAESLRAAWGADLAGEPFADKKQPSQEGGWASRRAMDSTDFARWREENYIQQVGGAVRKAAPEGVLTIECPSAPAGYFWGPGSYSPDSWAGPQMLDTSNVINAAYRLGANDGNKYPDLSLIGKPLVIGEWGNLIHPANARSQTGLSEPEGDDMWLNQNCQMFGVGAAQIRQWSWRDVSPWDTWLFNWGSVHGQCFVPKEAGRIIRVLYLLFRMPELDAEVQPVALLIPTSHRRGSTATRMALVTRNANKLLGAARVDYAPIAEDCLNELPQGVRALVWPMPYCPNDAARDKVETFVRAGGVLYLSGDISYDENRKLTREDRLQALCGVKPTARQAYGDNIPCPPEVTSAGAQWEAPFWVNKLGEGFVCYLPQNLEDAPIGGSPIPDSRSRRRMSTNDVRTFPTPRRRRYRVKGDDYCGSSCRTKPKTCRSPGTAGRRQTP